MSHSAQAECSNAQQWSTGSSLHLVFTAFRNMPQLNVTVRNIYETGSKSLLGATTGENYEMEATTPGNWKIDGC